MSAVTKAQTPYMNGISKVGTTQAANDFERKLNSDTLQTRKREGKLTAVSQKLPPAGLCWPCHSSARGWGFLHKKHAWWGTKVTK